MPGPLVGQIIKPGRALVEAGRAVQTNRRGLGTYPYQWMYPGPNAKQVLYVDSVAVPGAGNTVDIGKGYVVPSGMRFALRGVVVGFLGAGYVEGSGDTLFTLQVRKSGGNRNVDYLQGLKSQLGSSVSPYPLVGPLEFEANDLLVWVADDVATPAAAGNFYFAHLVGYEYPATEAVF